MQKCNSGEWLAWKMLAFLNVEQFEKEIKMKSNQTFWLKKQNNYASTVLSRVSIIIL